jgi:UDP:flavonoid glycosyltransferase YjiC (YdhE family)
VACAFLLSTTTQTGKLQCSKVKIQEAIETLLHDPEAKHKAEEFSKIMGKWDGPRMAAELLYKEFGNRE